MFLAYFGFVLPVFLTAVLMINNMAYFQFLADTGYPLIDFKRLFRVFTREKNSLELMRPELPFLEGIPESAALVPADEEWLTSDSRYMINMYYSQWSVYERNHFPRDIPYEYINHVFYCFMGINTNSGEVVHLDEYSDLEIASSFSVRQNNDSNHALENTTEEPATETITTKGTIDQFMKIKEFHPDLKVSMSIGGWGHGEKFSQTMYHHSKLRAFVHSAVDMMVKHGFDGIDIDWEFPKDDREAGLMVKLLKYLRYELNQKEIQKGLEPGALKLSVAVPCANTQMHILKVKEMDKYLSFWNLMCYDFAGEWSDKVEYHSNLYSVRDDQSSADKAVMYYRSEGVNPRKLVLGMPNYGRGFLQTKGYGEPFRGVGKGSSDEKGIWNYNFLPLDNSIEYFDEEAVAAYCYDNASEIWISYDNEKSAVIKAGYVKENRLGGGMWWESCGVDYKNLDRSTVYNFYSEITRLTNNDEKV